jgi:DNA-binding transcriptional LysR family regulator
MLDSLTTNTSSLQHIKLERQFGIRLFNRTTRSASLTDAGRTFVDQVGPALANIEAAMSTARFQQETPSETLRINSFATAAREILSPLILEFIRRYPRVHIDLVTEGRLVDVVADGFDLGIRTADLVPSDTTAIPLGPVPASQSWQPHHTFRTGRSRAFRPIYRGMRVSASASPTARSTAGTLTRPDSPSRSMFRGLSRSMKLACPGRPRWPASAWASSWSRTFATTSRLAGSFRCCRTGPRHWRHCASITLARITHPQPSRHSLI